MERSSTARRTSWCAREDRGWLDGDGIVRGGGDRSSGRNGRRRRCSAPLGDSLLVEEEVVEAELVVASACLGETYSDGDVHGAMAASRLREEQRSEKSEREPG